MLLISLIRQIYFLAFYFSFANMIFIDNSSRFIMFFIILASYLLYFVLRNNKNYSKLKNISFLGFILAALFAKSIGGIIAAFIPSLLLIYLIKKEYLLENYYNFKGLFIKLAIASVFLLVFILITNRLELFYRNGIQYFIIFIISGLYLLRTMRHSEDIINNKRFIRVNILIIVLACIICIIFSSEIVLVPVLSAISFTYTEVIIPIVAQILKFIFLPFGKFINRYIQFLNPEMSKLSNEGGEVEDPSSMLLEENLAAFYGFIVIAASIILILLIFLIKKLLQIKNKKKHVYIEGVAEYRSFLDEDVQHKGIKNRFDPTNQVRNWYRKFLELCYKNGLYFFIHDNSQTISNRASKMFKNNEEDIENIKHIYRRARYSNETIDKQSVKIIKNSYKKIDKK